MEKRSNALCVVLRFTLVQFDTIGADMSFVDAKFSKWGGVATAVFSQSLAKRFARVMLAAVLAASFLPVAAFADEGGAVGDPVGNEAVDKLAASDQPSATEPEAPEESKIPTEPDQPAATEPEAPAEPDQPAETESGASAVQSAAESQDTPLLLSTEDGSNDEQENGGKGRSASAISGPNQIKYYMKAQYTNRTSRSEYKWTWSSKDGGAIEISYLDNLYPNHKTVSVTGTELGHVTLVVSGGDVDEERFEIEITKRTVYLSSANYSKTYDGRPLIGEISVDGDGWAPIDEDGVQFNRTSRTNAGESENTFEVVLPLGSEEYFEEHYNLIITRYGVLTVEKRPVTLTSASGSKEYDGKPLTNHKVTVGEAAWNTGWVDGEGATYSFTGSQKIVGSSENTFECIPNEGTNLDNYEITKQYGTLSVTNRSEKYQITLTPNSKSETYDGTEKSVSGFEALEFEVDGSTYTVEGLTAEARGTDADEYPVKVSGQAVVIDSDGNDVTGQFIVNIDDAKLTIVEGEPAPIDPSEPPSSSPPDTKPTVVEGEPAPIDPSEPPSSSPSDTKPTVVEGEPAPIDPSEPPSSSPSKTTGKTAASKSAKTGDGIAPYVIGICGVAIVAGAVAFVARRKGSSRR